MTGLPRRRHDIGVHTPEFSFEHAIDAVWRAAEDLAIVAAWEQPQLLTEDVRATFQSLR